jgi:hypothetical protein
VKTRLLAIGLAIISAGLVACGGGGGGGSNPPTTPPSPTPTPTPYALGDSMTFSGSSTTAATFSYPSPSPYPATSATDTVSQTVTVTASPNPFGSLSAGDFHTVESDTAALATRTTTTDAWLVLSGAKLLEFGYKSVDDSGDSLSAQFPAPLVMDELPETNNASWSNSGAAIFAEKDADGTSSNRTYDASGLYAETTTYTGLGVTTSITENADGSGIINANGNYLGGAVQNLTFSAPAGGQVTVTANYVQPPAPAATIAPLIYTAPAWYGTGTPQFYSQNTSVTTNVGYPVSCSVPSSYGTSGNKLVQTTNRLDTIMGYTETVTQTTYTNTQFGPVCVVISDVENDYYDYQDDFQAANGAHFHFPGTPLSTTTIGQTLTLQAGAVVKSSGRTTQAHQAVQLSMGRIAGAIASIQLRSAHARHERELRFARFMLSHGKEIR